MKFHCVFKPQKLQNSIGEYETPSTDLWPQRSMYVPLKAKYTTKQYILAFDTIEKKQRDDYNKNIQA